MHVDEIQKRINKIPAAMAAKGLLQPDASFEIPANAECYVLLKWSKGGERFMDTGYEWCRGKTAQEALKKAAAYIDALPSAEEAKRNTFLKALGKVIDLGNTLGQDVGALMSEMKRISENAITDGRGIQPAE
jgi:hypothetical protein